MLSISSPCFLPLRNVAVENISLGPLPQAVSIIFLFDISFEEASHVLPNELLDIDTTMFY